MGSVSPIIAAQLTFLCVIACAALVALTAIAVSLREILRVLRGDGPSILTMPINSYGESIGDAIQGQMIRGQRGVDQYELR